MHSFLNLGVKLDTTLFPDSHWLSHIFAFYHNCWKLSFATVWYHQTEYNITLQLHSTSSHSTCSVWQISTMAIVCLEILSVPWYPCEFAVGFRDTFANTGKLPPVCERGSGLWGPGLPLNWRWNFCVTVNLSWGVFPLLWNSSWERIHCVLEHWVGELYLLLSENFCLT